MADHSITADGDTGPIPADDLSRSLTVSNRDDADLLHLSVVGDNHTVLVSGKQTEVRYCLIDMLLPDGRGTPLHRHRYMRFPPIRTTISSRCHLPLGRGRPCRSLRAISGPNFNTQRRTVS